MTDEYRRNARRDAPVDVHGVEILVEDSADGFLDDQDAVLGRARSVYEAAVHALTGPYTTSFLTGEDDIPQSCGSWLHNVQR